MRPFAVILVSLALSCWAVPADRTTEAGEAAILDPNLECTPYNYPPVTAQRNAFPGSWEPADILPNDSAAQDLWNSIQSKVPDIPPKTAGSSYPSSDPDCWWTATKCLTPKLQGLPPDIADVPEPDTLGYGFDDGPNCSHNAFYDFLASKNQKATFFFIGSNVMDWPLEAQRALADGHEICVHTWSHPSMTSRSSTSAFAELYYSLQMKLIKLVVGVTPTCWRPPLGDVDDRIRAIANALNLRTVLWKYDTDDWQINAGVTKAQIDQNYANIIKTASSGTFSSNGAIILTHELSNATMQEAVDHYAQLAGVFKHMVPIAVAYNQTQPYVETNYTMPTFEEYISGTTTAAAPVNANVTPSQSSPSSIAINQNSQPSPTPSHPFDTSQRSAAITITAWPSVMQIVTLTILYMLIH